jgi:hypothetical protein
LKAIDGPNFAAVQLPENGERDRESESEKQEIESGKEKPKVLNCFEINSI